MEGEFLENYLKENYKIYDRFSFDNIFRLLLDNGFEHDEALNFILCNCSLSTLVFQERIYNKYYLRISTKETISEDLLDIIKQTLLKLWQRTFDTKIHFEDEK